MGEIPAPVIPKDLVARLPRTFAPALNAQLKGWASLFPAEQRVLASQLAYLSGLEPAPFRALLGPVFEVEKRMDLPRWSTETSGMSVQEVGMLARSPHYPEWRSAVERVFSQIDAAVEKQSTAQRPRSVTICVLPSGLPVKSHELWPDLAKNGRWVRLDAPFAQIVGPMASKFARRQLAAGVEPVESTWILECETELTKLTRDTFATAISWTELEPVRREFLSHLNRIGRDLKSVDQTNADLKRMNIEKLLPDTLGRNARLRDFVRTLLLSGNGSLVFNNSFVQWGSAEALRRVQPQALIASFGIRQKLKPFSSAVLFEDQKRSNPTGDAPDPDGSLVDALLLAEYVHLAAQRVRPAAGSATIMAAADLDRILVLGDTLRLPETIDSDKLQSALLSWLS